MKCYPSRVKLLGMFVLVCALVGMFYFLTTWPELIPRVVGWFGLCYFGAALVMIPVMFFRTGAQVVINDEGIQDHRTNIGVIRWERIRSLSIGRVQSAKFLRIELADFEEFLSQQPRWKRPLVSLNATVAGLPALTISFQGLSPGLREVWAYLKARHGGASPA